MLDYGSVWFGKSPDSSLVKIEYNAGNRAPRAKVAASAVGGPVPLQVELSSSETVDPDGDRLQYSWRVTSPTGQARTFSSPNPRVPFTTAGNYTATLTATDPAGLTSSASVEIVAGNTPPAIAIRAAGLNQTFFRPGAPIDYSVAVSDREDATTSSNRVAVSIDYVPAGFDLAPLLEADRRPVDSTTRFAVAKAMMARADCSGCHTRDTPSVGPTFVMLSEKYRPDPTTIGALAMKVRMGGSKVWGEAEMPPHPTLTTHEIRTIIEFMLKATDSAISAMPLEGRYTPALPADDSGRGRVVVRAAYTDNRVGNLPAQTTVATKVLRSPALTPAAADIVENVTFGATGSGDGAETRNVAVTVMHEGHLGYRQIDMSGLLSVVVNASTAGEMRAAGGVIEIRLDAPTGAIIGQATVGVAPPRGRGAGSAGSAPPEAGSGPGAAGTTIALRPTPGVHDLYVVFRNPQALPGQALMTVAGITVGM